MTTIIHPYLDSSLMLQMSGANNGTSFTDRSDRAKNFTRFGNTKTVTNQFKHYDSSAYFDGSYGGLETPYHADFDFSVSDFTLDVWFRRDAITSGNAIGTLFSKRFSGGDYDIAVFIEPDNSMGLHWGDAAASNYRKFGAFSIGTWNHIAIVRDGLSIKGYLNGALSVSATVTGAIRNRNTHASIGRSLFFTDAYFRGWLQDLRIIKGAVLFDGPFDPQAMGPGIVNDALSYPFAFNVESSIVDLRGIAAPRVTLFNWDDPTHYAQCLPGPDDQWSLTVPLGLKYGLYYLSQDNRCPPIIHGPYTAE